MSSKLLSPLNYKIEICLISILGISWFPLLRFGFDPHHDGLITSTLSNLTLGHNGIGNWPFNQYGPAWFIILELLSPAVSSQYFFLTLRAITLGFYFLSFLFTFLVARRFLSIRLSLISVMFLMLIQPFVSDYNSHMIPWPSAFSMALIPLATWTCLRAIDSRAALTKFVFMGITSASIILVALSRVQIGVALFLILLIVLSVYHKTTEVVTLIFSSFIFFGITTLYLIHMGWASDVASDVFKFGSLYVTGDKSTLPKPIWTFLITFLLVIIIESLKYPKIYEFPLFRKKFVLLLVFCAMVVSAIWVLEKRGLNPVQMMSVAFRRFWISLIIASLVVIFIDLIRTWKRNHRLPSLDFLLLFIFAGVAELQVWPLFDQMHAWWACTPAVVLVIILLSRLPRFTSLNTHKQRTLLAISGITMLFVYSVTFLSSVGNTRVPLNVEGYSGVLISEADGAEIEGVDKFLTQELRVGSSVLNICTNGDPFFSPNGRISSASRAFVFWTPMLLIDSLKRSIFEAQPDQIVTCSFVTNPAFYSEYREQQVKVLRNFSGSFTKSREYKSPKGVTWSVYSRNN